jgi:peptidoglycan/xylan/chitin deacetylase (PgdA/CDA1 family)
MMNYIVFFFFVLLVAILIFLVYASYSIGSGVYVKAICRLQTNEKLMALTFDDSPHAELTPQILDTLAQHNIKAVFFCIGSRMAGNEALIKRIVEEGHLIGNHSFSHVGTFPLFLLKKMIDDLQHCEAEIRRITGQTELSLFRPPFGVTNPTVGKAVKRLRYKTLGWTVRSLDTSLPVEKVIARINRRQRAGNIILLHDTTAQMPQILNAIIRAAKANGYRFVRADLHI